MIADINALTTAIKNAGPRQNIRIKQQDGQPIDGEHAIEIFESGSWRTIASGVKRSIAEQIINNALNKVLFG